MLTESLGWPDGLAFERWFAHWQHPTTCQSSLLCGTPRTRARPRSPAIGRLMFIVQATDARKQQLFARLAWPPLLTARGDSLTARGQRSNRT
jgi:hypothetical protein